MGFLFERTTCMKITALSAIGIILLVVLILTVGTGAKQIELVIDGKEMALLTKQDVLEDLFEDLDISLEPHDRISVSKTAVLKSGDRIIVESTKPVQLLDQEQANIRYTSGTTVEEVLQDLDIPVGAADKVIPSLQTEVASHSTIEIIRVHVEMVETEESIPFEVVRKTDSSLVKGKESVIQEGQEGLLVKHVKQVYENGELAAQEVVGESVIQDKVDQIVAVGTKNPVTILSASSPVVKHVTRDDTTFGVKRVLENVTLTAYDAGFNSTGKTEEHPHYGITFTGTTVQAERTVAVDPKIIPLGWWIYIEGYGFRKAEDIGSAIKGKKIDIYVESERVANRFGLKRGYTVYVIGPQNPLKSEDSG